MWIALAIIGFLATLITVILLLPVKVILKNDEENLLILRYRFLFKTFGENPSPNDPITKMLKTATGMERLEKQEMEKSIRKDGLQKTVTSSYTMLADLLKQVISLLRFGTITRLWVTVRCTGGNPADAAIHYGQVCAATAALLDLLRSFLRVREKGCKIDIGCDFLSSEPVFRYELVLSLRVFRVLAALWKVALAEARRTEVKRSSGQQK